MWLVNLFSNFGEISKFWLFIKKNSVLTGYDSTSEVGIKSTILKGSFHVFANFKWQRPPEYLAFAKAQKKFDTFDALGYNLSTQKIAKRYHVYLSLLTCTIAWKKMNQEINLVHFMTHLS